jgi:hypothetical protein
MGKYSEQKPEPRTEQEAEPKFLTSWSLSRTKMDRLRNNGNDPCLSSENSCIFCKNPNILSFSGCEEQERLII